MLEQLWSWMPQTISQLLRALPEVVSTSLEEIRIREQRPLEIVYAGQYRFISPMGQLLDTPDAAYKPSKSDCMKLLDLLSEHSVYALEEELRRGFITVRGGHRVGLSGRTITERGSVKHIRDISSFNVRIARQVIGSSSKIIPYLYDPVKQSIYNSLLISSPQQGKTTILRDIAREISYGTYRFASRIQADRTGSGLKVAIVDERSEITASVKGVPMFDVGPRTDVMDGCPKAEGMMMMIRSMSPDVIIVDEIGRPEDAMALSEALHAGVRVVATAHGSSLEEARSRPILKEMLQAGMFSRYVILQRKEYNRGSGYETDFQVFDQQGRTIMPFQTVRK